MSRGPEVREPVPGDVIGDYRIESLLGRGGMGSVFKATQRSLGRSVAIKVLLPEHAVRPGAALRFEREAKVSAQLRHPNAIEVFDFGAADGFLYLAMELLEGKSMRGVVGDGRLMQVERAVALARKIAEVLVVAHARGIVHRDLKPENVFLERQSDGTERVVVVDFGLAFVIDHDELGRMTKEGMITGTPDYIAPEQAAGRRDVGPPVDIYALGCLMFEMFCGITPFHGNPMRVLMQQTHGIVPTFAEARHDAVVPRALEALVQSMLSKSPAARPTAEEIRGDLASFQHDGPMPERARERTGLDGRAARMVSEIRPPTSRATTLQDEAGGEAEVAVVGSLEGEMVLALAMNSLRLFIVSTEQPITGAEAIFAPGAPLDALVALRAAYPTTPIVTDARTGDTERVPALLRAKIDDVVMMPVRPEELGRRLWKLVRRARKTRELATQRGTRGST
jgi:serine/threonine protein kinase